jgi:hypothetical protein
VTPCHAHCGRCTGSSTAADLPVSIDIAQSTDVYARRVITEVRDA